MAVEKITSHVRKEFRSPNPGWYDHCTVPVNLPITCQYREIYDNLDYFPFIELSLCWQTC